MGRRGVQRRRQRGRAGPEYRFPGLGPVGRDLAALVEAAGQGQRVLGTETGEHHQGEGRPNMSRGCGKRGVALGVDGLVADANDQRLVEANQRRVGDR